ncbi:MAG: hypothetical protein ACK5LR_11305 [Mangrovibacterium sp.]
MHLAYVLYNLERDRWHYGCTSNEDLKKVENAHNKGIIDETRGSGTWTLMYHEKCNSQSYAIRRIRFFRSVAGQRYLKRILNY